MKKNMVLNLVNLFLGIVLAFLLSTNIEFNSTILNLTFPFLVLITGRLCYKKFTSYVKGKILFYLPSFIFGYGFYIAGILIILMNLLGVMFWFSEEMNKEEIQRCWSPNQTEYCEVYHYSVGAYSGGSGRIRVLVINKYFPLIRKEVYYEGKARIFLEEGDSSFEYVEWKDENTIIISDEEIDVHNIEFLKGMVLISASVFSIVLFVYFIIVGIRIVRKRRKNT